MVDRESFKGVIEEYNKFASSEKGKSLIDVVNKHMNLVIEDPELVKKYMELIIEKMKDGTAITNFSDIRIGDRLKITWPNFYEEVQIVWQLFTLSEGDGLHVQLSRSWGCWILNDPEGIGLNFILATQPFRVLVEKAKEPLYERECFRCPKTYYTSYVETMEGVGLCRECLKKKEEDK